MFTRVGADVLSDLHRQTLSTQSIFNRHIFLCQSSKSLKVAPFVDGLTDWVIDWLTGTSCSDSFRSLGLIERSVSLWSGSRVSLSTCYAPTQDYFRWPNKHARSAFELASGDEGVWRRHETADAAHQTSWLCCLVSLGHISHQTLQKFEQRSVTVKEEQNRLKIYSCRQTTACANLSQVRCLTLFLIFLTVFQG